MTEQQQQLTRVYAKTSDAVLAFIAERLVDAENKGAFTADQLRAYVNATVQDGVSPSSSDRILRMLRQKGLLDYIVLNRGKSLYRAVPLGTTTPAASPLGQ